ncbi:MAG: DUF1194 domain-containing protein [Hyphomonadaceae bacterium]|nr:DUF1194 domain-containing protein [Hyphomonadaceae bacterium]
MRRRLPRFAVLAVAALAAAGAVVPQAQMRVDLELVLAVDISRSMDFDEHTLQRNGYVEAFRHEQVINALLSGPEGRIAVTYLEWAAEPRQVIPWTIIDSEKTARDFADKVAAEPVYGERRTSISAALFDAANLIETNDITSHRQVIDVSGDGANNSGLPVEEARDFVLRRGITINGLPILLNVGYGPRQGYDIDHLDRYYKHCVIGGEGAFIAPVFDLKQLSATIRKKLVLEIAGLEVAPEAAAVQYAEAPGRAGLTLAQLKLPTEKTDCMSGEKARMYRGGGGLTDN